MNKFFVALALLPARWYRRIGVDTDQLKAILLTKLTMDDRRPVTIGKTKKEVETKPSRWGGLLTLILYAILGLLFCMGFLVKDAITQISFYFSFFIFTLVFTLISDFTYVLIDVRDNAIILPKPINDRTFLMSRLLHIIVHVSKLVFPMNLSGIIIVGLVHGVWASAILFLLLFPATLLTVFFVNALYLLVLKITTPEKFKNVIGYFQISFAILSYAAYQILPRLFSRTLLENYTVPEHWTSLCVPPVWLGAAFKLMLTGQGSVFLWTGTALAWLGPVLALWLVVHYFAPSFNAKLGLIAGSGESSPAAQGKTAKSSSLPGGKWANRFAQLLTRKGAERMGFLHSWYMSSRSRDFKMRVYPSVGYMAVYVFLIFFRKKGFDFGEVQTDITAQKLFVVFTLYMVSFISITALTNMKTSDKYKAGWLFYTTPIEAPGPIIAGSVKALILRFYLPIAAFIIAVALFVLGPTVLLNLALGLSNQICICFLIAYISVRQLPFSQPENTQVKGGSFVRGLMTVLVPVIMGFAHYYVYEFWPVVALLLALSLVATWLVGGSVYRIQWLHIKGKHED